MASLLAICYIALKGRTIKARRKRPSLRIASDTLGWVFPKTLHGF